METKRRARAGQERDVSERHRSWIHHSRRLRDVTRPPGSESLQAPVWRRFNNTLIWLARGEPGEVSPSRLCFAVVGWIPITSCSLLLWRACRWRVWLWPSSGDATQGRISLFLLRPASSVSTFVLRTTPKRLVRCFWCTPPARSWTECWGSRVTLVCCRACQCDYGNSQPPPVSTQSQLFLGDTEPTSSKNCPLQPGW